MTAVGHTQTPKYVRSDGSFFRKQPLMGGERWKFSAEIFCILRQALPGCQPFRELQERNPIRREQSP
jgi:hypothetical protein